MKNKKPKCYNCKHSGNKFKLDKLTHLHCEHPKYMEQSKCGSLSIWETLRVFGDTCMDHEFKLDKHGK